MNIQNGLRELYKQYKYALFSVKKEFSEEIIDNCIYALYYITIFVFHVFTKSY